jgi:hypothetical protein
MNEINEAARTMGRKGGSARSPRKTASSRANGAKGGSANTEAQTAARAKNGTRGAIHTGVVIFSGEGEIGTYRAWPGEHSESRIKARLTRERSHGDRWARAYVPASDDYAPGTYREILGGDGLRTIPAGSILRGRAGLVTYTITSVKGRHGEVSGYRAAIARAREVQEEMRAAYGVDVLHPDGRVVYTAR